MMDLDYLHDKLFEMLKVIDSICNEENITYFMNTGSAIGTVREHGFIPWDDDIDILMKRRDYMRFRKIIRKKLPTNYKFVDPRDNAPFFYDFIPQIIDMDTPLREETDEDKAYKNFNNRACIDIFILDDGPKSKVAQTVMRFKLKMLYGMAMSKRYKIKYKKYSFIEKIEICVLTIIGKPFSLEKIHRAYFKESTKYMKHKSEYYMRSNPPFLYMQFYKKEYFSEVVPMTFRDYIVPMPIGYDEVLKQQYGDYMTPERDSKKYITHVN